MPALRPNTEPAPVTRVVFTEPQVASVGTTLEAALAAGVNANTYDAPTSGTTGALFHGRDTPGTSRIVIDDVRGVIIGASFTGADVSEWLHAATIAIVGSVPSRNCGARSRSSLAGARSG